jgi:hypothetical protein
MSIKLHKVIHCFDSLIILLYEHPFTIYFDTHRLYFDTHRRPDLNVIDVWLYKILFNLTFIIISFMTHKNSILELILTDTYRRTSL